MKPVTGGAAHQAAIYVASNMLSRALSLVLIPLLTHLLPPSEYGLWGVALAWSNLATLLLLVGIYTPVSQIYFDEPDPALRREIYGTLFLFQTIGGAIAAFAISLGLSAFVPTQAVYFRLATWIGYFTTLSVIPLALMRV